MSHIEDLIAKYCPNGVSKNPISDLTIPVERISWSTYEGSAKYIDLSSVDRQTGHITDLAEINRDNAPSRAQQIVKINDVLFGTTRPLRRRVSFISKELDGEICSTGFCVLRAKVNIVNPKFLYHCIRSADFYQHIESYQSGASYPSISDRKVKSYKLSLPPLEVQDEIVRILDSFTQLEAELEAELEARRQQYEYYRDKLLSFSDDIPLLPLSDIAEIGTGSSNTNEAIDAGKYPFFVRSQEPLRKNDYAFDETAIITAGDGAVGKVFHYVDGKYALHQRAYRIHVNTPSVCPKFFFYYMKSAFLRYIGKTMYQGSVPSIRRPMLNRFPVPVPPLAEQERIVAILDKFDALINDLSSGLPAEIAARRKQYEYYRDQLLTFTPNNSRTANLSRATAS